MTSNKEYWDNIVSDDELKKARTARSKKTEWKRIRNGELNYYESRGWEQVSSYTNGDVRIEKPLPIETEFENRVWLMFYSMGYTHMNRNKNFVISHSKSNSALTKQIDVFAMDDETIIVVECKTTQKRGTKKDFLKDIGEFSDKIEGIRRSIHKKYGKERQIKFIWATANCILGEQDTKRLEEAKIIHFREEEVEYYTELAKHLGESAKYQLLGKLFSQQKIRNMPETVPAIRGKMGGHTYYSFSIEPERLLKIGYVLHRSDANYNLMPTYQRVIKKARLKQVREFVENEGYFPNSVIISIDAPKKGLQFDMPPSNFRQTDSDVKVGILHLPQKYCSAYIIDGQHRLYGYTGTKYAQNNTIPVVAFENLDRAEQVKLFMEINQNQKAVPLNLRNTLNASLLYESDNPAEARTGLKSKIAQQLGEDVNSPLYNRVVTGENRRNDIRCVTMETINKGLAEGNLLTKFDKDGRVLTQGLLDSSDVKNDYAYERLIPYLYESFKFFKEQLSEEWDKGQSELGLLTNNTGVYALLRCFSDILDFLVEKNRVDTRKNSPAEIIDECMPYYDAIVEFYQNLDATMVDKMRNNYGGKGSRDHWRFLQKGIHEKFPPFNPEGLDTWWNNNSGERNAPAQRRLEAIDVRVREIAKSGLQEIYGDKWEDNIPDELVTNYVAKVQKSKRRNSADPSIPIKTIWDYISLSDCRVIALDGSNWSKWFKDRFTKPGTTRGRKEDVTTWITDMHKILNELQKGTGKSVKVSEYDQISTIAEWICPDINFDDKEVR